MGISGQKLLQAAGCLLCAVTAFLTSSDVGSEFSAGRVTGPVLSLAVSGAILLVLALAFTFIWLRVAAVGSLVAAAFCLPLYFYLTLPGLFQRMVPGNYKVPYRVGAFAWDGSSIAGIERLPKRSPISVMG
jgi:hypothetical protein